MSKGVFLGGFKKVKKRGFFFFVLFAVRGLERLKKN